MKAIIVHGGAGDVSDDRIEQHIEGCREAARAGWAVLDQSSALDAVEAAVRALEDDPLFNAGTGACLNRDGEIELDACIMDGALRTGAVGALPPFRNPIAIARRILEDGEHVLYVGAGAARYALKCGFERALTAELRTAAAVKRWEDVRARRSEANWAGGTVGAVAVDDRGCVAAATSTGGVTCKGAGRVGDSAVAGAGNAADDEAGAASATGNGEPIIRVSMARFTLERLRNGCSPMQAAEDALAELARRTGAKAGIIVVDPQGRLGHARSTRTMTWARIGEGGEDAGA